MSAFLQSRCHRGTARYAAGVFRPSTAIALGAVLACNAGNDRALPPASDARQPAVATADEPVKRPDDPWAALRHEMVESTIEARGVQDPRVLAAMRKVARERFVSPDVRAMAYEDHPLPIGHGVTISQPYIVALMTALADVQRGERVLEIGTGSGYQAAVLAELGAEVYSIEIIEPLAEEAAERLRTLGYERVHVRHGDGFAGWPELAPFAAILVTAAPPEVPRPLTDQLAVGGRLVIPVGKDHQELRVIERHDGGFRTTTEIPVRFVPMTGKAQEAP